MWAAWVCASVCTATYARCAPRLVRRVARLAVQAKPNSGAVLESVASSRLRR